MNRKIQADNGDWISGPATDAPDAATPATPDTMTVTPNPALNGRYATTAAYPGVGFAVIEPRTADAGTGEQRHPRPSRALVDQAANQPVVAEAIVALRAFGADIDQGTVRRLLPMWVHFWELSLPEIEAIVRWFPDDTPTITTDPTPTTDPTDPTTGPTVGPTVGGDR